ncbi:hypothetical protein QBC34DRAFT_411475 [Podospora aff. communis PSN243]|uniref:Cytochrome c oxidase assembly protein COX20, mitochondrial n=1 Tax=Podospora aff. communis PSN243 TaxID=3040156 RepID=A0AAV9GDQ8_9PEZI|nr:hypothetical protein QBC34DRAFT_411475 [Podospora aff. communis PSN243]
MSQQPPSSGLARSWLSTAQPPPPSASPPSDTPPTTPTPSTPSATPSPAPNPPQQLGPSSVSEVVTNIKPSDFLKVHQAPCSQQGFTYGIGIGAFIGLGRWVMGLPAARAAHWAVGTGAVGAIAQYEYCQYKRRLEREKMLRMVEVYTTRQAKEKAEAEEKRARERREKEEREQEAAAARGKSWWKVW